MKQIDKISIEELRGMADTIYDGMVKANVDVAKKILVADAELHADIEQFMLDNGSNPNDIWGINLYPDQYGTQDFLEFDSMINIRPSQGNRSRGVEDAEVRAMIMKIVSEAIIDG